MLDYNPTTGRYIQVNPLGLVDGASIYGYALQNPMRYVDPQGLTVGPGHKNYEYCKSLKRRMDNIRKNIRRRERDLVNNRLGLPERAPGEALAKSTHGHRVLINRYWKQLWKLEKEYTRQCGGDDCERRGNAEVVPSTNLPPPFIMPRLPRRGGARSGYSSLAPGSNSPIPHF